MTETPLLLSRREENKQATRLALARAALDVVARDGMERLTADAIAEQAGVSRRTFFNYFAHVEDALLAPVDDAVDVLLGRFLDQASEKPLREAVMAVLAAPLPAELLAHSAVIQREASRPGRAGVTARRFVLETAAAKQPVMERALAERIGPVADPVYVAAFSAGFLGVMCRIDAMWVDETGGDVSLAGIERHHDLMRAAVAQLLSGFHESAATSTPIAAPKEG